VILKLKAGSVSIIYISHRLEEIFELSQHITILKDGTYVDTVETANFSKQELVNLMVGRELKDLFPKRQAVIGDVVLKAEDIHAGKMVQGVSFEVQTGEVLGVPGLVGSRRTETMRAISGRKSWNQA
jgi:ribose transport system ATP-binding protein